MKNTGTLQVTTPTSREIVLTRVFDAPRHLVFDAFSKPELLKRWFGPRGFSLVVCEVDLRVGGGFRFLLRGPDGRDMGMRGVYREITAPERSVHMESFDDYPGESQVTMVLTETDGKTTMTATVLYPSEEVRDIVLRSGMEHGAAESYDKLAELLQREAQSGSASRKQELSKGMSMKRSGRLVRYVGAAGLAVCALIGLLVIGARIAFRTDPIPKDGVVRRVVSRDGTSIAYEVTGRGPALVLVSAALTDRSGNRRLAAELAKHFTVINYDRRGRGDSTDVQPWGVAREVEDLEALVDASGGPVFLFGSSSGSVLALDAASQLGAKIGRLFIYEPPFIVDGTRPPISHELCDRVASLAAHGETSAAVKAFFTDGMGIPGPAVTLMRLLMPGWSRMEGMAHTIPYDLATLSGTQSGKLLPVERWAHDTMPTMVAVGSRSEVFFHTGARALAASLPQGTYRSLDGRDHSAVLFAPAALAQAVVAFFGLGQT